MAIEVERLWRQKDFERIRPFLSSEVALSVWEIHKATGIPMLRVCRAMFYAAKGKEVIEAFREVKHRTCTKTVSTYRLRSVASDFA